jgi:hypothetical protein
MYVNFKSYVIGYQLGQLRRIDRQDFASFLLSDVHALRSFFASVFSYCPFNSAFYSFRRYQKGLPGFVFTGDLQQY